MHSKVYEPVLHFRHTYQGSFHGKPEDLYKLKYVVEKYIRLHALLFPEYIFSQKKNKAINSFHYIIFNYYDLLGSLFFVHFQINTVLLGILSIFKYSYIYGYKT